MLVLLAEDSDTSRDALVKQIEALGHSVHPVRNGWEAVLCCHAYRYDLIFMDMHMPVMDGWDATQMIRDIETARRLPAKTIVAVTSLFDRQACISGGMNDYLPKPISNMQLSAILRKWALKQKVQNANYPSTPTPHPEQSTKSFH